MTKVLVLVEVPAVCPHCALLYGNGAKPAPPVEPAEFGFCSWCHGTFRYRHDGKPVLILRKDEPRELGPVAWPLVCRMRESLGPKDAA